MSNVIQLKHGMTKPPNNTLATAELGLRFRSFENAKFIQLYGGGQDSTTLEIGVSRLSDDGGVLNVGSTNQPVYFSNGIPVAGYSSYINTINRDHPKNITGNLGWIGYGPLSTTYVAKEGDALTNNIVSAPPEQNYGIILNMTNSPWQKTLDGTTYSGSDVCQFWFSTLNANLYKRGGNYNGWQTSSNKTGSDWVLMLDENNYSTYCLPNETVPISKGGTNATTAAAARNNLGITPANIGAVSSSGGLIAAPNRLEQGGNFWGLKIESHAMATETVSNPTNFSNGIMLQIGSSQAGKPRYASIQAYAVLQWANQVGLKFTTTDNATGETLSTATFAGGTFTTPRLSATNISATTSITAPTMSATTSITAPKLITSNYGSGDPTDTPAKGTLYFKVV